MTNLWRSWTDNCFGEFNYPSEQNCKPYTSEGTFTHWYKPYDPFDMDWLKDTLTGSAFDLYSYALTWNENIAEIELDIPGVKKDDISVIFEPDHLLINSNRKGIKSTRKIMVETRALDHDKCEAKLEHGVLSLKLIRKAPIKKTLTVK